MNHNIILIGMSGVGKSTIGEALATKLNMEFIDTDVLIENKAGKSIENIFSVDGEDSFRKLESSIIDTLSHKKNIVLSTGGGIILNKENVIKIRDMGIVVLLDASIDNIIANIKKSSHVRPLLKKEDELYKKVQSMYNVRKELYFSSADAIIFVDGKSIEEIIYEVLSKCVKINS